MASSSFITQQELTRQIKDKALDLGFDLVGIAPAQDSPELACLERWLDAGYAGRRPLIAAKPRNFGVPPAAGYAPT